MNLVDRFWIKVDKNGPTMPNMDTPCWVWTAFRNPKGYGIFSVNCKNIMAHRVSWETENEHIPIGLFVLHHCDNPSCIRVSHLFLGTNTDNQLDMWRKGRHSKPDFSGEKSYLRQHPEKSPGRKINREIAEQIRSMYATGNYFQRELGTIFGLNQTNVGFIVRRKTWK